MANTQNDGVNEIKEALAKVTPRQWAWGVGAFLALCFTVWFLGQVGVIDSAEDAERKEAAAAAVEKRQEAEAAASTIRANETLAREVRGHLQSNGMVKRYEITDVTADGSAVTITTAVFNDADAERVVTGICTETVDPLGDEPSVVGVESVVVLGRPGSNPSEVLGDCRRP